MRKMALRIMLIAICISIVLATCIGAVIIFIDPLGENLEIESILPALQTLPFAKLFFQNFILIGIALFISLGLTNALTAILLVKEHRMAYHFCMFCAFILLLWAGVMIFIFDFNAISNTLFFSGIAQFLFSFLLLNDNDA